MSRKGWRNESYRHYLAAKGVKTNRYSASKASRPTDDTAFEFGRLASGVGGENGGGGSSSSGAQGPFSRPSPTEIRMAQLQAESELLKARPEFRALDAAIVRGDVSEAVAMLNMDTEAKKAAQKDKGIKDLSKVGLSASTRDALVSAVETRAFQLASAGQAVDQSTLDVLSSASQQEVKKLKDVHDNILARETESPFKSALRAEVPRAVGVVAGLPERGIGLAGVGIESGREALADLNVGGKYPGLSGQESALGKTPFLKDNAVVGWEEQARPSFYSNVEGAKLNSSWDFISADTSTNVVLEKKKPTTVADLINEQVNSLHDNKSKLSDASDKPFKEGKKHFDEGDRESLLKDIIALRGEEDKLRDRQTLVEQTRRNVLSPKNHVTAFNSSGGPDNIVFSGNKGGEMLAEQTKKVNDVREAVAKRHSEIATRRKILENDFSRLMTEVKPSDALPKVQPTVLTQKKSFFGDNTTVEALRSGPYGKS